MPVAVNRGAINTLLRDPGGPLGRSLDYLGARINAEARAFCPVDTGRLRRSIHVTPVTRRGNSLVIQIGSNVEYAIFVHEGHQSEPPRPFLTRALEMEIR